MTAPHASWTRETTACWQSLEAGEAWRDRLAPPYRYDFPVPLGDGRVLVLPIREIASRPGHAVASLIANQASFEVVAQLASTMAALARPLAADVVVGLPTLGMVFAPPVAQAMGHTRWVPLGYSRKFWYDEALSTTVSSITTPGAGKAIYLDPNQWPLLCGRRVVVVDDAISSGHTMARVWDLLERLEVEVAGVVVAMRQGPVWRDTLGAARAALVQGAFDSPLLVLRTDGWWPAQTTTPAL